MAATAQAGRRLLRADGASGAQAGRLPRSQPPSLEGKARKDRRSVRMGCRRTRRQLLPRWPSSVKTIPRCRVVAIGRSVDRREPATVRIRQREISGSFWVVVNSVATNLTDAAELVVMNGSFTGQIQVADAAGRIIEILPGACSRRPWCCPGSHCPHKAFFTGTFRLPFTVHHVAVYLSDRGRLVPVLPDERALGDPTVRLEVDFD